LRMPHFLAQESKGCDCIVLWLDCDKVPYDVNILLKDKRKVHLRVTNYDTSHLSEYIESFKEFGLLCIKLNVLHIFYMMFPFPGVADPDLRGSAFN
jgi:hypothetical protein